MTAPGPGQRVPASLTSCRCSETRSSAVVTPPNLRHGAQGIRRAAAALRRAPNTAHAAELDMVGDGIRHGLQPVVVAGPAPPGPEVLRLAERHLDGEQQVAARDRDVVIVWHVLSMAKEHVENTTAASRRRRQEAALHPQRARHRATGCPRPTTGREAGPSQVPQRGNDGAANGVDTVAAAPGRPTFTQCSASYAAAPSHEALVPAPEPTAGTRIQ